MVLTSWTKLTLSILDKQTSEPCLRRVPSQIPKTEQLPDAVRGKYQMLNIAALNHNRGELLGIRSVYIDTHLRLARWCIVVLLNLLFLSLPQLLLGLVISLQPHEVRQLPLKLEVPSVGVWWSHLDITRCLDPLLIAPGCRRGRSPVHRLGSLYILGRGGIHGDRQAFRPLQPLPGPCSLEPASHRSCNCHQRTFHTRTMSSTRSCCQTKAMPCWRRDTWQSCSCRTQKVVGWRAFAMLCPNAVSWPKRRMRQLRL